MKAQKIDISTSTLVRFILLVLAAWLIYLIRDVFIILFLVIIIVSGLAPTVDRWARTITRPGAVVSVFLLFLISLVGLLSLVVPPFIDQLGQFADALPGLIESISNGEEQGFIAEALRILASNIDNVVNQLGDLSGSLFTRTIGFVNGLVAVITVLILSFYLLLDAQGLNKIYKGVMPPAWHEDFVETTKKITSRLGAWLRAQIILMIAVGFSVTIGLLLIRSPYALSLGIWAGLMEAIPIVGPWIGALPGVAIGLSESPLQGFLTLMVYLVVQQLESSILVPKIMGRSVGLNPVVVIVAILIGGKLYGLWGILLAVPLTAVISVIIEDWATISQRFGDNTKDP